MKRTLLGGLLLVVGAVVLIVSALADPLALGSGGGSGSKQVAGVIVGCLTAVVGAIVLSRARRKSKPEPTADAA